MEKTRHVLISLDDFQEAKYSGILFNNQYILTTSKILTPLLFPYEYEIKSFLTNFQIINFNKSFIDLRESKISIIHESINKQNTISDNSIDVGENQLFKSKASLLCMFNCENECNELKQIFTKFNMEKTNENNIDIELNKLLISSFILLSFDNKFVDETLILDKLNVNGSYNKNQKCLTYKTIKINQLDEIISYSTPFGQDVFFKTINVGKISNILGCIAVTSLPLCHGCEGGGIYNSKSELIGIVVCTILYSRDDNISFTLFVKFDEVFLQLSKQLKVKTNIINEKIYLKGNCNNTAVLIKGKNSLGSGSFVKIKGKRFILTCSHVIKNNINTVDCKYSGGSFTSNIIFKNTNAYPYDIAILDVPKLIPELFFAECSKNIPVIGQPIFSVGFPIYSNINLDNIISTICEGRVTKYSKGVIFTDILVQAGQSGGGIYDINNKLLGISVLNIRYQNYVLPRINLVIPIFDILNILEEFSSKADPMILKKLIKTNQDTISQKWNLKSPKVLSRL